MSLIPTGFGGGTGAAPVYDIDRSLRIRGSAASYVSRTPSVASNRQIWTWSGWVKRTSLSGPASLFSSWVSTYVSFNLYVTSLNTIAFDYSIASGNRHIRQTDAVFRDTAAHYHVVFVLNTTLPTASDRAKLFVNGYSVATPSIINGTWPTQNDFGSVNTTNAHHMGRRVIDLDQQLDGYLSEINFVDGQALTPDAFGEFNSAGVWVPKAYGGTYGTNGFYLKFNDGSNLTNLCLDRSGNSNNWTPTNISLTAGVTYDWMLDTPTDNYPVLNPLNELIAAGSGGSVVSDGGLKSTGPNVNVSGSYFLSTLAVLTGKWYAEVTINPATSADFSLGILSATLARSLASDPSVIIRGSDGSLFPREIYKNGVLVEAGLAAWATNDVCGIALDLDAGTIQYYRNNVAYGAQVTGLTTAAYCIGGYSSKNLSTATAWSINFGQRPFAYTPPAGFIALRTSAMPSLIVQRPDKHFDAYLYTGNGGGLQVGEVQKELDPYTVQRSLRFRAAATARLERTFAGVGNRKTWTWSAWVKRGSVGVYGGLFGSSANGSVSDWAVLRFSDTDTIQLFDGPSNSIALLTTNTYRDPSLWINIVLTYDTDNATASLRQRIYVDGVQLTLTGTPFAQGGSSNFNLACLHVVGCQFVPPSAYNLPLDGYMAEVHFVDGQALTPSSFGQTDGNGYWVPKAYSGTYGTNGFYTPFTDTTSPTTLGDDLSGNNNDWTPTNISLTAGATYDSMVDVPGNTFCVIDPLATGANSISNANLTLTYAAASVAYIQPGTFSIGSGVWVFEANLASFSVGLTGNNAMVVGFVSENTSGTSINYGWISDFSIMRQSMTWQVNNVLVARVDIDTTAFVSTDILAVVYDIDAAIFTAYKNGVQVGQITSVSASGNWKPMVRRDGTNNAATWNLNFGQRLLAYSYGAAPRTLCENNVPEDADDMESPGLVWIKNRSAVQDHALFDQVRGVGKYLRSNTIGAETTDVNSLTQFNRNGFYLGASAAVNTAAQNYVAWAWKASGAGVTNTAGSITSTVSANTTAGISVVTYTGTGVNATVGHGLGFALNFLIVRRRDTTASWSVWQNTLAATDYLLLENTNGKATLANVWNSTYPSSTVFSLGTNPTVNAVGGTYVAYCFTEAAGFSKFGQYTGNGLADGPFVYCGFRPRYVLTKCSDGGTNWVVKDTARSPFNTALANLYPNSSAAEDTAAGIAIDLVSNGFKIRGADLQINSSGFTYMYVAFAENPLGGVNVSPANAR